MGKLAETDAERFRQEAEDCRRFADRATDPADREHWLQLADDWTNLAETAEQPRRF